MDIDTFKGIHATAEKQNRDQIALTRMELKFLIDAADKLEPTTDVILEQIKERAEGILHTLTDTDLSVNPEYSLDTVMDIAEKQQEDIEYLLMTIERLRQ